MYPPLNWADCNGQQLPVSQYTALFAIIRNTFGGNGQTTYSLPNLQGRPILGVGQGTGLSGHVWGQTGGTNTVTLTSSGQLPSHTHSAQMAKSPAPSQGTAAGNYLAFFEETTSPQTKLQAIYEATTPPDSAMAPQSLTPALSANPTFHENRQPFLALRFCIALDGIFPTQN